MSLFYKFLLAPIILIFLFTSCRKDNILTDPSVKLSFSRDTVHFDTVFTSIGSSVRLFKVFNTENKRIQISNIRLGSGDTTFYRLNVDGVPGKYFTNVDIEANDSIYVFVAVTIDPTNVNNPFLVSDSVVFSINGNEQKVYLDAYGQNAYFHYGEIIDANTIWNNDKPHVIINSFLVDSNVTLTITAGTLIYMHANSALFVNGTLICNGTKQDSIVFQGDRLENFFIDLPGNWGYIRFLTPSKDNYLEHVIVKDALNGIVVDQLSVNANYKLTMKKCQIRNMFYYGIQSATGSIKAENCLVYNCGEQCLLTYLGGDYKFDYCTFANYGSEALSHQSPSVGFTNYFEEATNTFQIAPLDISFTNCIIYGGIEDELSIDSVSNAAAPVNYVFKNCNIKSSYNFPSSNYINCQKNQDPLFSNYSEGSYKLLTGSPCIGAAFNGTGILDDYCDIIRNVSSPNIGCLEI
jgi:hypothetical protein